MHPLLVVHVKVKGAVSLVLDRVPETLGLGDGFLEYVVSDSLLAFEDLHLGGEKKVVLPVSFLHLVRVLTPPGGDKVKVSGVLHARVEQLTALGHHTAR